MVDIAMEINSLQAVYSELSENVYDQTESVYDANTVQHEITEPDGVTEYIREVSAKSKSNVRLVQELENLDDIINKGIVLLPYSATVGIDKRNYANDELVSELQQEVKIMRGKLSKSFPTPLVMYLCMYCSVAVVAVTLFFLQLVYSFKFLDFYVLLLLFVSSFGLAITTISTIKEFRKRINE